MSEVEAGLKFKSSGEAEVVGGLDQIEKKLGEVENKVTGFSARMKGWKNLWEDPVKASGGWSQTERVLTSVGKAATEIVGGQLRSIADAVTAPAQTSYAGAIAMANVYRDTTQRIVSSTGQGYSAINQQVLGASARLGLMPGQVQSYGRGVRSLTGDWQGAMAGLDAYQARALQTDRTLEQMVPTAAHLAQTFGISSTNDVMRFFGTIDTQARLANVSATVLERTFLDVTSAFSGLKKERGGGLMALTAAVMGGAPSVELGQERLGGIGSFLMGHRRLLERRAHQWGTLKKGEHFYDAQGQSTAAHTFGMIETLQREAQRKYMTKDRLELLGRMEESGTMPAQIGAGLMALNIPEIRKRAEKETGLTGQAALDKWKGSEGGSRIFADAQKIVKDTEFGNKFLGAQDTAVGMGGGAAGVALAASGQIFEKATGVFADAVNIFAGRGAASSAATAAGVGASGLTTGTAATAGGLLAPAVGAIASAVLIGKATADDTTRPGMAALLGGGAPGMKTAVQTSALTNEEKEAAAELAYRRQARSSWTSRWSVPKFDTDIASRLSQEQRQHVGINADGTALARTNAEEMAKQTLKVQIVSAPSAPPGQEQPK